jgi:hypothetical protein
MQCSKDSLLRFSRDLAIVLSWTIVVLFLLELGVRGAGMRFEGSFYQSDPVCYTAFRPNAAGWITEGDNFCRLNSAGMRDRERSVAKPADTLRIAVLGDSLAAAMQVPLEQTMAQQLESRLSAAAASHGRRVEVLNFAVGGYTPAQMYLQMREKIWRFQPDIVMVFWSLTSVANASRYFYRMGGDPPFFVYKNSRLVEDPKNSRLRPLTPAALERQARLKDLYNRVYLLQLGMTASQKGTFQVLDNLRRHEPAPHAPPEDNLRAFPFRPPASPEAAEAWHVADGLLGLMHDNAISHGAEFWLVSYGDEVQRDPDPREREAFMRRNGVSSLDYADKHLEEVARKENAFYIAMAPPMLQYAEAHQVLLHGFFNTARNHGHLNEVGNRVAAEVVAGEVLKRSPAMARHLN